MDKSQKHCAEPKKPDKKLYTPLQTVKRLYIFISFIQNYRTHKTKVQRQKCISGCLGSVLKEARGDKVAFWGNVDVLYIEPIFGKINPSKHMFSEMEHTACLKQGS